MEEMLVSLGNACFVGKMRVSRGNAYCVGKMRFWCKNCMITWLVAKCKLPLDLRNGSVVENRVFVGKTQNACCVENSTFHCKMPNVSRNNSAYVMKECLFLWKMPNFSVKTNQTHSVQKRTFHCMRHGRRSAWCLSPRKCMFERTWWQSIDCGTNGGWWSYHRVTSGVPLRCMRS